MQNTALSRFSIVLLVTNQAGKNFNAGIQRSIALSHIFSVLYLSWQCFNIKGSLETSLSDKSWVMYQSGTESDSNGQVSTGLSYISWV